MVKLKETFLKKYGVWEYVLFAFGAIVLGFQVYSYMKGDLQGSVLDGIMAVMAIFAISAPLSILELARKKTGMTTRQEKLNE